MRTGHLSVQQGKQVIIHLRTGEKILGYFKERKARTVEFEGFSIPTVLIRTLTIIKGANEKKTA